MSDQSTGSTSLVDHTRAVKEYSRSSADQVSFICLLLICYSVFFKYIICLFFSFLFVSSFFCLLLSVLVSYLFSFLLCCFYLFCFFAFFPPSFFPLTVFLCSCFSDCLFFTFKELPFWKDIRYRTDLEISLYVLDRESVCFVSTQPCVVDGHYKDPLYYYGMVSKSVDCTVP